MRLSDFHRAIGHEVKIELTHPVASGRKRFRGVIRGVEGEGQGATLALERTDARSDEEKAVSLPLADLDEGRLVLTEALIRESLRAGKLQQTEEKQEEAEADAEERPRRGPGRFRGPAQQKQKPLAPAGVQTQFKKAGGKPKPSGRSRGD